MYAKFVVDVLSSFWPFFYQLGRPHVFSVCNLRSSLRLPSSGCFQLFFSVVSSTHFVHAVFVPVHMACILVLFPMHRFCSDI